MINRHHLHRIVILLLLFPLVGCAEGEAQIAAIETENAVIAVTNMAVTRAIGATETAIEKTVTAAELTSVVTEPSPTPPPTTTATSAPTATEIPEEETVGELDLEQEVLSDGRVVTVVRVEEAETTIGSFNLQIPESMMVDRASLVKLTIDPDKGEVQATLTPTATAVSSDEATPPAPSADFAAEESVLQIVEDQLEIFPEMTAVLRGPGSDFHIETDGAPTKPILTGRVANWNWFVTPLRPGSSKTLLLEISIPVTVAGGRSSSYIVSNQSLTVLVQAQPTPIPTFTPTRLPTSTPTPDPGLGQQLRDSVLSDTVGLISAILTFIVGIASVAVAYLSYRNSQIKKQQEATSIVRDDPRLRRLHRILDDYYNDQELRTLCLSLGIDYDDLPAVGQGNKARELVALCARNGRIDELVQAIRTDRPNVAWPET